MHILPHAGTIGREISQQVMTVRKFSFRLSLARIRLLHESCYSVPLKGIMLIDGLLYPLADLHIYSTREEMTGLQG